MATRRAQPTLAEFSEKEFYLDEFRGRTLVFAVHHDAPAEALRPLGEVARDLLGNDTRVLVLLGGEAGRTKTALRTLERALGTRGGGQVPLPFPRVTLTRGDEPVLSIDRADVRADRVRDELMMRIWAQLRDAPFFLGLCDGASPEELADFAQRIGARFRVHKLVIVDPAGGVRGTKASEPISFLDESVTEQLLQAGEAESAGLGARRRMLDAIRRALVAGIDSVNLCTLEGMARELFTYEGTGTLFTNEDYVRVAPLALDDYHEVEKLLERGQREGYLKTRSADEIGRILIAGYGATIGRHHLAGVCSLQTEQYARERGGEIVGLYTITRFKGEGVGVKLVDCMKAEGRRLGLAYLFACTTHERVGHFFERQGFVPIAPDDAPPEKWACYDDARRRAVAVYRFPL